MQDSPIRDLLSTWQSVKLPGLGSLRVRTSPNWIPIQEQTAGLPPTFGFRETATGPDRLIVTVTPIDADKVPTADQLLTFLQQSFDQLRGQVREEKPEFCQINTNGGRGFFFTVTDPAPKADEFLYMTSGFAPTGGVLLAFTVLTNPQEQLLLARAFATIRSAVHDPDGVAAGLYDSSETTQQVLVKFLDMDLNSEASLFVQAHPELMSDSALQQLQVFAQNAPKGIDHNRYLGAALTLRAARVLGIAGVFAPMQLIAPINLACFAEDTVAKHAGTPPQKPNGSPTLPNEKTKRFYISNVAEFIALPV